MPVMQFICRTDGAPTPIDGHYLVEFDPNRDGGEDSVWEECQFVTTEKHSEALQASFVELFEIYRQVSEREPTRPWDGKPNRPLTAMMMRILR